ncbi:hypothetical protein Hypma_003641 [Hypsizygus marmoreus]|uniref:MYND-type domain-containing protein n=1 Tax=Hypsizygus marmoreus TaxID=39966 RepID=A0A369J5B8_HYPMA|nr:hypothetical protein Hypma_003641 [Hypsizygus marmoreus]
MADCFPSYLASRALSAKPTHCHTAHLDPQLSMAPPRHRRSTQSMTPGNLQILRMPSYEDDPMAWNAAWEKHSAAQTALMTRKLSPLAQRYMRELLSTELTLTSYRRNYAYLCVLQCDLSGRFASKMAVGFEKKWLAATASVRRNHLLEGHIRAAIAGFERLRSQCGDVTFASLENNNGEGFLKLLKIYLLDDISSVPTTPISFSYYGTSGVPMCSDTLETGLEYASLELCRNLYICSFLFFTLDSWECKPRPLGKQPAKIASIKAGLNDPVMKLSKAMHSPSAFKEIKQDIRSTHAVAIRTCESCGKPESMTKHMQCKTCNEVLNRTTSYCSRQCQKNDWPRHKQICGKKLTLETAQSTALAEQLVAKRNINPAQIQIGPSVGGYKRSPALIAQVYRLNLKPDVDYFITLESGRVIPASFEFFPKLRDSFRTIRDKAMITGDRNAVTAFGEFLIYFASEPSDAGVELSSQSMTNQLVLEYGESLTKDLEVLRMKCFLSGAMKLTQIERHMAGQEIYDITTSTE